MPSLGQKVSALNKTQSSGQSAALDKSTGFNKKKLNKVEIFREDFFFKFTNISSGKAEAKIL